MAAFDSARRAGLDVTVILCNDAAHGAEHLQLRAGRMDPAISTFDWLGFATTARTESPRPARC